MVSTSSWDVMCCGMGRWDGMGWYVMCCGMG